MENIKKMKEMKDVLTKIDTVFKTEKKKISLIHYLQQDLPDYDIEIHKQSDLIAPDFWIKYYLDHKVLYKKIDGNYILNMGGWHGKK